MEREQSRINAKRMRYKGNGRCEIQMRMRWGSEQEKRVRCCHVSRFGWEYRRIFQLQTKIK